MVLIFNLLYLKIIWRHTYTVGKQKHSAPWSVFKLTGSVLALPHRAVIPRWACLPSPTAIAPHLHSPCLTEASQSSSLACRTTPPRAGSPSRSLKAATSETWPSTDHPVSQNPALFSQLQLLLGYILEVHYSLQTIPQELHFREWSMRRHKHTVKYRL